MKTFYVCEKSEVPDRGVARIAYLVIAKVDGQVTEARRKIKDLPDGEYYILEDTSGPIVKATKTPEPRTTVGWKRSRSLSRG